MDVKSLLVNIGANVKGLEKGLGKADGLIKSHSAQFRKAGMGITAAGGAIVGALGLMVKGYVKAGDEVHKMALRTNMSAESLSQLKHAAELSGTSLSTVEKSITKLQRSLVEGVAGSKLYVESFEAIGISVKDIINLSPEEQFMAMADAIGEMAPSAARTAATMQLLGKSGTELLPMFADGAEGIKEMMKQADELGLTMSTEAAQGAADLADAMANLKGSMQGLTQGLAAKLAPTITKIVDKITNVIKSVVAWTKKNPILTGVIIKMVGALGSLMVILGPLLMMLPGLAAGIALMGPAFTAALGPIALIIAAITVAVAIITTLITRGKQLKETMAALGDSHEEIGKSLDKVAEKAGMTAKEFEDLTKEYDGNYKKMVRHIEKGKLSVEMQKALAEYVKEVASELEDEGEILGVVGDGLDGFANATEAANDKLKKLSETLVKDVKKALLSEYEYAKWAAEKKYEARKTSIANEEAAESNKLETLAMLNDAYRVEQAGIEATENERKGKEAKEFWKGLADTEKAFRDTSAAERGSLRKEYLDAEEGLKDSIFQFENDKFTYAALMENKKLRKRLDSVTEAVESGAITEQEGKDQLILIEQDHQNKIKLIKDAAAVEQSARIQAEKAEKKQALENTLADITMVLGQIGGLFRQSLNLKLTLIDNEEKAIFAGINRRYEADKRAIENNITDEEAAAEALLELDEAKTEALLLASEGLERKREDARRKMAKQEKAVALLSAIVNTAAAVVKSLPNIPLAIAMGVLGGIQIALIAATPVPLKKGGIVTTRTVIEAGEAGPEAIIPLNKPGMLSELFPTLAPNITIEMEPVIIQRENGDFVISIVKKAFKHRRLLVPVKAIGG